MTPEKIAKLRKDLGWTLEAFGHALGVSYPTVWRWEHGQTRPMAIHMATMRRMREQLDAQGAGLSAGTDVGNEWKTLIIVGGLVAFLVVLFNENK